MNRQNNSPRKRELFRVLYTRELRSRFVGNLGGWAWLVINPLFLLAIYSVVFRSVFRIDFPELGRHSYMAFIAVALWPWLAFQEALLRGTQSIQANANLVKKVAFPHEFLVLSTVTASFTVHALGYCIVLSILSLSGEEISLIGVALALPILICLTLFTAGIALALAACQVFLRDLEQVVSPVLTILFYATPILYVIAMVPPWAAAAVPWNPLVHYLIPVRTLVFEGSYVPALSDGVAWLGSFLVFLAGRKIFHRLAPYFEDFV